MTDLRPPVIAGDCPTMTRVTRVTSWGAMRAGRRLSDPIDLGLFPGTILGVVGPNGVGKSSFLAALAHTDVPSVGTMHIGRTNLSTLRARDRARVISFLPQDLAAPRELLVSELVQVGAFAGGRTDPAAATQAALAEAGIEHLADKLYGTLSGGQKQLAQIARVLAQDTPIVILDEPTAALDLFYQGEVERLMRVLSEAGKIVIVALHDLSLALNSCTQVLLLSADGSAHAGRPTEVLNDAHVLAAYGVHSSIYTTDGGRRYLAAHPPRFGTDNTRERE